MRAVIVSDKPLTWVIHSFQLVQMFARRTRPFSFYDARRRPSRLRSRRIAHVVGQRRGKCKFSHTHYRALDPELIPVYRQSARRWREVNHAIHPAVGCRYFLPGQIVKAPNGARHTHRSVIMILLRASTHLNPALQLRWDKISVHYASTNQECMTIQTTHFLR